MEYDNNHFIIASRAYSLQRPPMLHLQWSSAPLTSGFTLSLSRSATPLISPLISPLIPLNLGIRVSMY
jgi:hypothetical protein